MLFTRLKLITLILFVLAAVATGVALSSQSLAGRDEPEKTLIGPQREAAARPKTWTRSGSGPDVRCRPRARPGRETGAECDRDGLCAGEDLGSDHERVTSLRPTPMGQATTDNSGVFRLESARISSSGHDQFGAVALAPGYGAAWVDLDPDAAQPRGEITLRPEQVIQGRLFDVQGRPAGGRRGCGSSRWAASTAVTWGPVRETLEGPVLWHVHGKDLPAWPHPATTDAEGRFTLRGVGRGLRVTLLVHDLRFAWQFIPVDTDHTPGPKQVTIALEPAKIIKGRVTYADTARPVPHARLSVGSQKNEGNGTSFADFETDDEGRFRVNPRSGDTYFVTAYPPAGQPYLGTTRRFEWPKGAVEQSLDLALDRGVVIRGKVTEDRFGQTCQGSDSQV